MNNFNPFRVLAVMAVLACLMSTAHAEDTKAAIEAANAQFSAAAAKGDAAGMAALYAADGQVLPAASEPIKGREAIQKFWQGALSSGVAGVSLKTLEVLGSGKVVTEVGHYELRDKTDKVLDQGKYIVVWRSEGGSWKLARDMFSTNNAPPKK